MKKAGKIFILIFIIILLSYTSVYAHGGNITGWKDKNSDKIIEHNGDYYGYHNQDGVRHYHKVQWNETDQRWDIIGTAICYDENFNIINNYESDDTEKIEVKYSDSVDGDTAKFELNGEIITVRFLGIDTPETVHPTKGEEPYGKDASNFTKEKLQNAKKIEIEYDKNADKKDKYDRHLAWIWVDDNLLQKEIIANGLAKTYMLQDNYKYAGLLQASEETAKEAKLNIWSNDKETEIQDSEVNIQDNEQSTENTENVINVDDYKEMIVGTIFAFLIIISIIKGSKKTRRRKRK